MVQRSNKTEITGEDILHWALADECVLVPTGLLAEEAMCDGVVMGNRSATGLAIETMALGGRVDSSRRVGGHVADDALAVLDVLMRLPDEQQRLLIKFGTTRRRPLQRLPGVLRLLDTGARLYDHNRRAIACWVVVDGPTEEDQRNQARLYRRWHDGLMEFTRRLSIERKLVKHKLVGVFSK